MVSLVCVRFHVTQIMLLQKKNETNECNLTQRCIARQCNIFFFHYCSLNSFKGKGKNNGKRNAVKTQITKYCSISTVFVLDMETCSIWRGKADKGDIEEFRLAKNSHANTLIHRHKQKRVWTKIETAATERTTELKSFKIQI